MTGEGEAGVGKVLTAILLADALDVEAEMDDDATEPNGTAEEDAEAVKTVASLMRARAIGGGGATFFLPPYKLSGLMT